MTCRASVCGVPYQSTMANGPTLTPTVSMISVSPSSTGEAEPRGSSCVLYDTYNTFCTIHIRNIGRYEWAYVVCRKAQVVQSLPHHANGRSGAEREFLRRNIGRYEWASVVCRKAQVG